MPDKEYKDDPRFQVLKSMSLAHWEEHLPKTLARLQKEGKADKHLDSLVKGALQETDSLLQSSPHLHPDQIREIVLPEYIYIPGE